VLSEVFRQLRGRLKWQDSRRYVDRLIAAVFRYLSANCSGRKPEHENQLRPLVGLTPEQAQTVWECAAEKASGRKTTAQMVKSAVKELHLAGSANPVTRQPRQNKDQQRKLIDGAIGELLVLLSQKATHEVLTQKVEALHGHIRSLFPKPSSKPSQLSRA
jgi:hypothetical protein